MGRELGDAGPATVGFCHFFATESLPVPLTEVDQDFPKISCACKMLQWTIEKQRLEGMLTKELNYLGVITLDITISPEVL